MLENYSVMSFAPNGLAAVKFSDNGILRWEFINAQGEVVIPFQFERIEYFSDAGLAEVRMNGKWGCINTKGEMVVPCEYSYLSTWDKNGPIFVKK